MKKLTNTEIKKIIFEILCVFAQFCDENGLRYYLCGGTLLGAIRHKEFIPWDDDIDVLMPRPDYNRLHKILKEKNIRPYYTLISIQARNSFCPFAKIIDNRTHIENKYATTDKHLWIDIFPMDGLPENKNQSNKILDQAKYMKKWFSRCNAKIGAGKNKWKSIFKIPFVIILKACKLEKKLGTKLDKLAHTYDFDSSDYIGGIAWSLGAKERMKKSDYLPVEDVEFCGKMFHVPACWDYYLTRIYGDYMKLPPKEQRVSHEFLAYIRE